MTTTPTPTPSSSSRRRRGHVYRRRTASGAWGNWHAVIDVAPPGAPRRQVTRSFPTQRQAWEWLDHHHAVPGQGGVTLGDYLIAWLDGPQQLAPSTRRTIEGHLVNYLLPILDTRPVAALSTRDVQTLHERMQQQGASAALIHRVHATLSSALSHAVREGLLSRNPARDARPPRRDAFHAEVWSLDETRSFLAYVTGDKWEALWRMALVTGMRRGELLGLRWRDVDLTTGWCTVRFTRTVVGDQVVTGPPKTPGSRRAVSIDKHTRQLLITAGHDAEAAALAGGEVFDDTAFVFATQVGTPLPPANVSARFKDLQQAAGVPVIRFHDLRHVSATLGLVGGETLKEVSTRLGHSSIAVTADIYTAVPQERARQASTRLGRAITATGQDSA